MLEPRAVGLLEPEPVVEQPLAVALEGRPLAGVVEHDVDLPDLLVDLGRLERDADVALLEDHVLLAQAGEPEGLDAGRDGDLGLDLELGELLGRSGRGRRG